MRYLETAKASLEAIRNRPVEEVTAIRNRDGEASQVTRPRHDLELARIATMSLDEFALAGLKVQIHSRVLGREVLFVSDNVADGDIDSNGLTVYRADELRKLAVLKPKPRSLRTLHEVKSVFSGTIEEVGDE
ncbi:MAG: hypothetical protein HC897_04300 [Thermoanaerobaculia bacterium]|nr:hypothetical protein [Thermoanaerobaculia bacterium]